VVALAAYGLSYGGQVPLQETICANYIGRHHLGEIRSVGIAMSIGFGADGLPLAGALYDSAGSYDVAFVLCGVALVLFARPPRLHAMQQERLYSEQPVDGRAI
jgi:hypothetical protein